MGVKIALAGNPNCGKTTLFNALTGSNQFVGNWPGVTVEKKEGKLKGAKDVTIVDLPGIYSLSPYTLEEVVARNYLITERPDVILNIVDGTNLERNLYLSTQIMELGIPVVLAVNMMDLVEKNQDQIHIDKLGKKMGCEAVEISALKGTGIEKAANKAVSLAKKKEKTARVCQFQEQVEKAVLSVEKKLGSEIPEGQKRFFAIKLLERDDKIGGQISRLPDVAKEIETLMQAFDDDVESIITNERYEYISSVIGECYTKSRTQSLTISDKIDRIVTNRILALPIFAAIMWLVYYVSVSTIGSWATDWVNDGVFGDGFSLFGMEAASVPKLVEGALDAVNCADWLKGLVLDGIVGGVGATLGFTPQMFVLFFFLAFLEGCGYMARVAFIMDRIFRKFGLSGKSFIPMLIGTGCGVPGILASRTIEQDRDRKMTVMTTTFIPCGAKLPIIALIAGAFFHNSGWVSFSAFFVGIAAVICSGVILKKTKMFSGEPAPFVMDQLESSILAALGGLAAPLFTPLGWGDWKMAVATFTGLIAKENVVMAFGTLFGFAEVAEDGREFWQALSASMPAVAAYSFLVFNLLCAPCFAAMGAMKREMNNGKWFWFAVFYQTAFAYLVSFCIYQIGAMVTTGAFGVGTILAVALIAGFLYLLFRPYRKSGSFGLKMAVKAK